MSPKKQRKERQKEYNKWRKTHPQHADGIKRFIYNEVKQKDDYGIMNKLLPSVENLKYVANSSEYLLDEEIYDLKLMLQDKLGKKAFKKLRKIFAK